MDAVELIYKFERFESYPPNVKFNYLHQKIFYGVKIFINRN